MAEQHLPEGRTCPLGSPLVRRDMQRSSCSGILATSHPNQPPHCGLNRFVPFCHVGAAQSLTVFLPIPEGSESIRHNLPPIDL